jgi:hypothetical protein
MSGKSWRLMRKHCEESPELNCKSFYRRERRVFAEIAEKRQANQFTTETRRHGEIQNNRTRLNSDCKFSQRSRGSFSAISAVKSFFAIAVSTGEK